MKGNPLLYWIDQLWDLQVNHLGHWLAFCWVIFQMGVWLGLGFHLMFRRLPVRVLSSERDEKAGSMKRKQPSLREMELECENWNLKYPVGTHVNVRMDSGEMRETKTRSVAQILSGHTAVIWLDGISGFELLSRVSAIQSPGKPVEPKKGTQGK